MKQKAVLALAVLGIVLVSGCVGSGVADQIPTKDLPSSLQFNGKEEIRPTSSVQGIKNIISFTYSPRDKQGPDVTTVDVFELSSDASVGAVQDDIEKGAKDDYIFQQKRYNGQPITEEAITIGGVPVKHLQIKILSATNPNDIVSIHDSYIFASGSAVVSIKSSEFLLKDGNPPQQLQYRQAGLELTKAIINNLKK